MLQIRCVFVVLLGALLGNDICEAQNAGSSAAGKGPPSGSSDLDAAYKVIYRHSPELESGHVTHLESINQRKSMTRAIKLVLDSMKQIAKDTDLKQLKYRTMSGLGNNLDHPMWGASLHPQLRLLANSYDDGAGVPRYRGKSGNLLPSARDVSVKCFLEDEKEADDTTDKYVSQMFMQFGQFLDHDIIFTEVESASDCCKGMNADGTHSDMTSNKPCFPIKVESGDRHFGNCMSVKRSFGETVKGVREQINAVSSYVDASHVYGPSDLMANELRSFSGGKLKVTSDNGLPRLDDLKCLRNDKMPKCPHAGDPRVNVFPGLTIIHTIFHREHNRIAEELAKINPGWDDERLFQEARRVLMAINQKITYEEYLPKVLGDFAEFTGVTKNYTYNSTINAGVTSIFGAAAFRFGHSQINGDLKIHKTLYFNISDTFFKPEIGVLREGELKNIIINQAKNRAMKTDQFFTKEVLDHLFEDVDFPGESFDLPGLAVQRCRDHGLRPYLDYVDLCVKTMSGSGGDHPPPDAVPQLNLPTCFSSGVYETRDDIDVFVGAMYETPVRGALVGPTFAYLIGEQFARLKHGDRFWWETREDGIGFTDGQLAEIKAKGSLALLICKNSIAREIHPLPMLTRRYQGKKPCSFYQDIDWTEWRDPAAQ